MSPDAHMHVSRPKRSCPRSNCPDASVTSSLFEDMAPALEKVPSWPPARCRADAPRRADHDRGGAAGGAHQGDSVAEGGGQARLLRRARCARCVSRTRSTSSVACMHMCPVLNGPATVVWSELFDIADSKALAAAKAKAEDVCRRHEADRAERMRRGENEVGPSSDGDGDEPEDEDADEDDGDDDGYPEEDGSWSDGDGEEDVAAGTKRPAPTSPTRPRKNAAH